MHVPVLDLQRQYETIREEIDAAALGVIRSAKYVLGPYVREFEEGAAAYCGAKDAIGVASGTDALLLSLRALDIGPGDGVILPSFTFFATAGVVHNVGATPVFCDIDPKTFNLDTEHLRSVLEDTARGMWPVARGNGRSASSTGSSKSHGPQATGSIPRIKAIIPVHLYGQIADMDAVFAIARDFGLSVIEDAAQAIGATIDMQPVARGESPVEEATDRSDSSSRPPQPTGHNLRATPYTPQAMKAGTLGDLGCFSFYPTKNLGAYGDGGMVTSMQEELAESIRLLRVHGAQPKYFHKRVGYNSRLDAIQAAILGVKLRHLDAWSEARAQKADVYDEGLKDIDSVITPYRAEGRSHIFHQYTIRVPADRRDPLREHLKEQGIGTMVYYPRPLHLQECFADLGYSEGQLPESERASREAVSLPIFPELTDDEQEYVIGTIGRFMG